KDRLMAGAVALYHNEKRKDLGKGEKRLSLQEVCKKIKAVYKLETREVVNIDASTLGWLVEGGTSKSITNEAKGWLLLEEVNTVIQFAMEVVNHGFPLTHEQLKEHVDDIYRACLSNSFPLGSVSKSWTS
ncbi:hypothetical protein B0H10DRAFT_1812743, partial [Mycena sp. CBHHK59/15]